MSAAVRLTPEAEIQAAEVDSWWTAHRLAAPALFAEELLAALDLLERVPGAGVVYRVRGVPGLRRLLLPRTRYHVYYVHDPEAELVAVVAVWSAVRGQGPPLPRTKRRR